MKLRNKATGEKYETTMPIIFNIKTSGGGEFTVSCESITELIEDWEDYEEPKEHWCVTMYGGITRIKDDEEPIDDLIEIGNYFNDKESAYDALDKLKAWKRLKDNGFKFKGYSSLGLGEIYFEHNAMDEIEDVEQLEKDLDLLFEVNNEQSN